MKKTRTVDEHIANETLWHAELVALADILRQTKLEETIKWGAPCYVAHGQNVVGMMAFKNYFGLWFHQGVLLADKGGVLINAQAGTTKTLRQWRMISKDEIKPAVILRYVNEAIQLAKDGKAVKPAKNKPLTLPPELVDALDTDSALAEKFAEFTKSKKRECSDYITGAKQDAIKQKRLDKIIPMIKAGMGLHDKYR